MIYIVLIWMLYVHMETSTPWLQAAHTRKDLFWPAVSANQVFLVWKIPLQIPVGITNTDPHKNF